jgi:hypothetical protein
VAVGGAAPAFDAPAGDRQGQLSGFPLGDARTREPFKLGGATSDSAADEDHETLAGEVPGMTGPEPDQEV